MKKLSQYILVVVFGALPLFVLAQSADSSITTNLYQGLRGAQVTTLQLRLQALGYFGTTAPSGFFGVVTKKAVQDFQKANGIDTTGYVGPLTRKALSGASPAKVTLGRVFTKTTRAKCLAAIKVFQSDDTATAKKVQSDALSSAASLRDAAYAKAATALTNVKTKAAGVRDATFATARVIGDIAARTAAIQKAIDIYNASVNPAVTVEASARALALADYNTAAKKVDADYTANLSKIAAEMSSLEATCPAK